MSKIFVYGTLKKGFRAHNMLTQWNARFLGEAITTSDYQLYRVNWFPGMVRETGECGVKGELYEITEQTFPALDRYEGAPSLFVRQEIELDDGEKVTAYLYNRELDDLEKVESGVWEDGHDDNF